MPSSAAASRSRHYSGMDYASDTEALQSPVLSVRGMRSGIPTLLDFTRLCLPLLDFAQLCSTLLILLFFSGIPGGRSHGHRTNSLPRTFQREALLRHPELSMEMDRLASPSSGIPGLGLGPDDPMSDSGIISAPENMLSIRNKRGMYERIFLHFL